LRRRDLGWIEKRKAIGRRSDEVERAEKGKERGVIVGGG
jgi:hypothetical protein